MEEIYDDVNTFIDKCGVADYLDCQDTDSFTDIDKLNMLAMDGSLVHYTDGSMLKGFTGQNVLLSKLAEGPILLSQNFDITFTITSVTGASAVGFDIIFSLDNKNHDNQDVFHYEENCINLYITREMQVVKFKRWSTNILGAYTDRNGTLNIDGLTTVRVKRTNNMLYINDTVFNLNEWWPGLSSYMWLKFYLRGLLLADDTTIYIKLN